jgi:hypothetical protein
MLHMTKVAVGCASVDVLRERQASRVEGGEVAIQTRYLPKQADAMIGGSLYWIIKHQLVVRQQILGFGEGEGGRCLIRLDAELVTVRAHPKRAHQGWRYLEAAAAPADLDAGEADVAALPPRLLAELAALALL